MLLSFRRPLGITAAGLTLLTAPLAAHAQAAPAPDTPAPAAPAPAIPVPTVPQAPAPQTPATSAKAVLDQAIAAHQALNAASETLTVQTTGAGTDQSQTITLAFLKPGMAKADITDKAGLVRQAISNGKLFSKLSADKKYTQVAVPSGISAIPTVMLQTQSLLPMMLAQPKGLAQLLSGPGAGEATVSSDTLGGVPVDTLAVVMHAANGANVRITLAFGHGDHLLRQFVETQTGSQNGKTLTHTETVTSLTVNPTLTASAFVFTPPPGAKKAPAQAAQPPMHDPRLVPGARPFPIEAKDLTGQPLSLAQYRGKVVLMDFWATWCGPCVGEMPNVIAAYKKYHAQGFDVVGISLDENHAALTSFLKQNGMPWRQVFDGKGWGSAVPTRYGVHSIPFGLLIGRDGTIQAVEVRGPDLAPAIQQALAKKTAAR